MRSRSAAWLASLLWLALATTGALGSRRAEAASLDEGTPVVCWAAKTAGGGARFDRTPDVAVGDVLAQGLTDVLKPRALCAPAGPAGPADPGVHWERYRVRAHDRVPTGVSRDGLHVVTAEDTYVLDLRRPTELLAPTAVDPDVPVAALPSGHPMFQCYVAAVDASTFAPGPITLDTGAGPTSYRLRRPTRLCLGVGTASAGPHLLCFAASAQGRAPSVRGLHTHPSFGPERLDRRSLREVCVPALLDGVTPPPTTTTSSVPGPASTTTTLAGPTTTTTTTSSAPTTTTTTHPPVSGVLLVPAEWPSIQAAVDVAAPGATIRVAPGQYHESIFVSGSKDGLTIESADVLNPAEIIGVVGSKLDGIRADFIDDLTVRHLRIYGAYDAIRLNYCTGALLEHLDLENSALGVRINNGEDHVLRDSTIDVTRVEQGIWIEYAPDTVLERVTVTGGQFGGIRIRNSDRVRLTDVDVADSDGSDGIKVEYSPDARVESCSASSGYARGFRIINSPGLVFTGNVATGNATAGIRIENSEPFATAGDVLAAGNTASGNDPDVSVQP